MSMTTGHQIAFTVLSEKLVARAEAAHDRTSYEVLLRIADALADAATALGQRDAAASDKFDHRHSTVTYDPKAKNK